MMVVITVSKCPTSLRGDLSRWLIEIDTGVFVGNLSARVRDAVWDRICRNIKIGRASMAFGTNGEQKLDFRIHNTDWEPVDYDGIKLVRRNKTMDEDSKYKETCKAVTNRINALSQKNKKTDNNDKYITVDIETTGLDNNDSIIEIGAILIEHGNIVNSFSRLIKIERKLPREIVALTGITDELVFSEGVPLKQALGEFLEFCANNQLVGHNINFDMKYLQRDCLSSGFPLIKNKLVDTMRLSRRVIDDIQSYGLKSIAEHFGIEVVGIHRALDDAKLTYRIYEKLKEI